MDACHFPISFYLPETTLTNDDLAALYPGWTAEKILAKTGVRQRHVCGAHECASDLAEKAALRLFADASIDPAQIDFVLLATQSPDYHLPTTACMLQNRLGIPTSAGALDINLGCSAYIYGLAMAKGVVVSKVAGNVLLVMAETYSKHIHPMDKSARTIFGDAAAATLINAGNADRIGSFVLGTDGSGAEHLIVPVGGARKPHRDETYPDATDESGNTRSETNLFMDGPEIFNFTISTIPKLVRETLAKNNLTLDDVDLFVFHQANKYMLDFLRKKTGLPEHKFVIDLEDCGNTVSASIPIALRRASDKGILKSGDKVMLVGFGVGLSWGATVITW
jgi:3-oxoacyl-[acyl-carrier-protein] synthase-3